VGQKLLFDKTLYGESSLTCAVDWRSIYFFAKKPAEAEKAVRNYLSIVEKVLGRESQYYLHGLDYLCNALIKQRRFQEAENVLLEQERLTKRIYGEESNSWADILENKIDLYKKNHIPADVIPLYRELVQLNQKMDNKSGNVNGLDHLASALTQLGQYAEADSLVQQVLRMSRAQYGNAHNQYFFALSNAAFCIMRFPNIQK
jgi:tetratricopeptide (TPR) repeat protein